MFNLIYFFYLDIEYHFEDFKKSIEYRQLQKDESEKSLGVHPLTAKAYYLLAKSQQAMDDDSDEYIENYKKAKEMFVKMKDDLAAQDPYITDDFITKWSERLSVDKTWFSDTQLEPAR